MRFRVLTTEELEPLQEEFLKYLIVQNILPEAWEQLKVEDTAAAEKHIAQFSELVFDKIMQQNQFLERISAKRIEAYHFLKEEAYMIAFEVKEGVDIDFTTQAISSDLKLADFNIIKGNKKYTSSREEEMFVLTQQGCSISTGEWYKKLMLMSVAS